MTDKFRVVCYQRIDRDLPVNLTWDEAREQRKLLELACPEDFFVIEEVRE